jgi:outer membrane protein TolC
MIHVKALTLVLLAALEAAGQAQVGRRPLTVRDAVDLALRHNPTLGSASADVRAAAANVEAAQGIDDFLFESGSRYAYTELSNERESAMSGPDVVYRTGSFGLSLIKPLSTGGQIGLGVMGVYTRADYERLADLTSKVGPTGVEGYQTSLQLTFQHSLLRGGGASVARADQRRARAMTEVASLTRQSIAAQLLQDVVVSYWDLFYVTRELEIRRTAAASAREQYRRVQANIEVGKQPRSALAEIEVAIALRDEAALLTDQLRVDRALELGRLCGLSPAALAADDIVASEAPRTTSARRDRDSSLAEALRRNPLLAAVRAKGRAATIEVDVTRNALLPRFDVFAAAGPLANDAGLHRSLEELSKFGGYTITAGFTFQHPIGRHAARGMRDAASEGVRKAQLSEAEIAAELAAAVVRGTQAVDTARRRVEVLAGSLQTSALDLEAERARFEVGRSTNFDVLRRQEAFASVQLAHLRAQVDLMKALASVDALTGRILVDYAVMAK